MIDLTWVNNLEIQFSNGLRIEKCLGIGAEAIIFKLIHEGKATAFKMQKDNIGFVIKEFPPIFVNAEKTYDINKLNLKIANLVGNPAIDRFSGCYNELCSFFIKSLIEGRLDELVRVGDHLGFSNEIRFFLNSYSISERLNELREGAKLSDEFIYEFKDPYFNYMDSSERIIKITSDLLTEISNKYSVENFQLKSEIFYSNPLFIWGAAVMDGFVTDKLEMEIASSFITNRFGNLANNLNVNYYLNYANFLATFIYNFTSDNQDRVEDFVNFCSSCGCLFQVFNTEGEVAINGINYRFL